MKIYFKKGGGSKIKSLFFKYKWSNILIVIFICLTSLTQVFSSLALSNLLNSAIGRNLKGLYISCISIFVLWLLYFLFELIYSKLQSKCIAKMNNHLRSTITNSISEMNYEQFQKNEIGTYVSWYTNDMNEIENSGFKIIYSIIYRISSLIFVIWAITRMHYLITITMLTSATILLLAPKLFKHKMSNLSINQSKSQELFTKHINDILFGFNTLKIYNSLYIFKDKIDSLSFNLEKDRVKLAFLRNNTNFILGIINFVCQLSCSFVAAYLIAIGKIDVGMILAIGNLSSNCFNSIRLMTNEMVTLNSGKEIYRKLNSLIKTENSNYDLEKYSLDYFDKDIVLDNLSYSYNKNLVLNNISIRFERGKKYAIVGPSGCGKSTLLKIIMGHLTNFEGEVLIDSININQYDVQSLYNNFAYIDQNVYLFNTSIIDNICMFKSSYDIELLEKVLNESALQDFNTEEQLNSIVGENGKNLSGGQKQRISIARALFNQKSVIIMDEGTSALDKQNSYAIEEKLLNNPNITVIIVSHNIDSSLEHLFDDIYNLKELNLSSESYN